MGAKWGPTNRKHGCESKIGIYIYIDASRDNRIVSENNRSITINPWILPWEDNPSPWQFSTSIVRKDTKLEYVIEANRPYQISWRYTVTRPYKFGWWSEVWCNQEFSFGSSDSALEVEPRCTSCVQQIQDGILKSGWSSALEHKKHSKWVCVHDDGIIKKKW